MLMSNTDFLDKAAELVIKHSPYKLNKDNIFVVWANKVLQNNKALLGTTIVEDNTYYEVTYNGDINVFYVDVYRHHENYEVKAG